MKLLLTLAVVIAIACAQNEEEDHSRHPDCQPAPCPRGDHGNMPYPMDCTKYVSCEEGRPEVRDCPAGYKYHKEGRKCEIAIGGAGQGCLPCWRKHPSGL